MQHEIARKLLQLNKEFYARTAAAFSRSRHTAQPGVRRVVKNISPQANVLDLGCGNGTFRLALHAADYQGEYLGIDQDLSLLADARFKSTQAGAHPAQLVCADLSDLQWPLVKEQQFEVITCFAMLHHIPSLDLQQFFFNQISHLLKPNGFFYLSVWQLRNSPKLKARLQPWDSIGIDPKVMAENDLLMDWRAQEQTGQPALRYVHEFTSSELAALGNQAALSLKDEFYSDGKTGDLALYQVWQKLS